MLYFAYGSNLDEDQLRRRCPGARCAGRAVLLNHTLVFDGYSRHWEGPVANVVTAPGSQVCGLVYELTDDDLRALDGYERHPHSYTRTQTVVVLDSRRHCAAVLYARPHGRFPGGSPPDAYYRVLHSAYERLGYDPAPLASAAGKR